MGPNVILFMADFNVWRARSAKPLDDGRYGAMVTWQVALQWVKSPNSALVNTEPFTVTSISGIPWVANIVLSFWIVTEDVACFTGCTSIHLEWASTSIRNIWPSKGPAKSACTLAQAGSGHFLGYNGAFAGDFRDSWRRALSLTPFSNMASIPGHQTLQQANPFTRTIPGWAMCSKSKTRAWADGGTTTLLPQSTQPCSTLNSACRRTHGWNTSPSNCEGHHYSTKLRTFSKIGSQSVLLLISCSERGSTCRHSKSKMVSPGNGTSCGMSGSGKRLRTSAMAWSLPCLWLME